MTFPPYLKDKSLAGKTAIFDVTVLAVDERTLPVVDDAFASGVRPGLTVQGLEDEIRSALDQEDAREFEGARNKALETALVEKIDMVIPETLVTIQAREKVRQSSAIEQRVLSRLFFAPCSLARQLRTAPHKSYLSFASSPSTRSCWRRCVTTAPPTMSSRS